MTIKIYTCHEQLTYEQKVIITAKLASICTSTQQDHSSAQHEEQPRLTEFRLEFKAKVTTSNALATSTHKQSDGKLDKQDKSNHRHKNSPMYASFIPSSKV
jgi:hypothetical protein